MKSLPHFVLKPDLSVSCELKALMCDFTSTGVCCASLEDPKALMKMGLSMVLIGHVNFLLGALVHGVVLRHINLHKQARAMEYAISNVFAFTSGLVVSMLNICPAQQWSYFHLR